MTVVWRPLAMEDRAKIMDHIAADHPLAAMELDERIEEKANRLLDHPTLYRLGRKRGTREMMVHPNYVVIYRVQAEVVEVLRVKKTTQK